MGRRQPSGLSVCPCDQLSGALDLPACPVEAALYPRAAGRIGPFGCLGREAVAIGKIAHQSALLSITLEQITDAMFRSPMYFRDENLVDAPLGRQIAHGAVPGRAVNTWVQATARGLLGALPTTGPPDSGSLLALAGAPHPRRALAVSTLALSGGSAWIYRGGCDVGGPCSTARDEDGRGDEQRGE